MQNLNAWLNTGLVSLAIGYLGYRSTRAGQKTQAKADEAATKVAEAAEKRAETQQALDAQKSIAEQYQGMATALALQVKDLTAQIVDLHRIINRDIDLAAAQTEQAMARPTLPPQAQLPEATD